MFPLAGSIFNVLSILQRRTFSLSQSPGPVTLMTRRSSLARYTRTMRYRGNHRGHASSDIARCSQRPLACSALCLPIPTPVLKTARRFLWISHSRHLQLAQPRRLNGPAEEPSRRRRLISNSDLSSPGFRSQSARPAAEPNFRPVRVSDDMRLIVHRTPTSLPLCYVGHHDAAYAWAEPRRIERPD